MISQSQDKDLDNKLDKLLGIGVILRQETTQLCRILCFQPNINWSVSSWTEDIQILGTSCADGKETRDALDNSDIIAFVNEDAGYWGRCWSYCAPASRATRLTYHTGTSTEVLGERLFYHEKGCTNGQSLMREPCCCLLPYLDTYNRTGSKIGRSEYVCDLCLFVPKYRVLSASGQTWYAVSPDTICGGFCVKCKCDGDSAKCFRIPFYVRDPITYNKIDNAQFVDLWAGAVHEVCTKKNIYSLMFPVNASIEQKCSLLGCAHLVDLTFKEQEGG